MRPTNAGWRTPATAFPAPSAAIWNEPSAVVLSPFVSAPKGLAASSGEEPRTMGFIPESTRQRSRDDTALLYTTPRQVPDARVGCPERSWWLRGSAEHRPDSPQSRAKSWRLLPQAPAARLPPVRIRLAGWDRAARGYPQAATTAGILNPPADLADGYWSFGVEGPAPGGPPQAQPATRAPSTPLRPGIESKPAGRIGESVEDQDHAL